MPPPKYNDDIVDDGGRLNHLMDKEKAKLDARTSLGSQLSVNTRGTVDSTLACSPNPVRMRTVVPSVSCHDTIRAAKDSMTVPLVIVLDSCSRESSCESSCSHALLDISQSTGTSTTQSVASCSSDPAPDFDACGLITDDTASEFSSTASTRRKDEAKKGYSAFNLFRMQYLIVHTAIMLADGLQGKQL